MSTSLEHLLPAPEQAIRCAEHARTIGVDPGGTAIRADRVVLVPTPAPWPKPALGHPLLIDLAARLAASEVPTRLLAAVPGPGPSDQVVVYDRTGGSAIEQRFAFDGQVDQLAAIGRLLAPLAGEETGDVPAPVERHEPARPAVLICTQGSHDVCCGSEGTRLAESIESQIGEPGGLAAGLQVVRVSHTGGHRFAPTAMTLPDGRMWAGLDTDSTTAILGRSGGGSALSGRCRGWWGAETGAPQIAERAVFAELGWQLDARARTIEPADRPGPGPATGQGDTSPSAAEGFIVVAGDDRWRVDVALGREVPTIACREPGGLPVKPAREYRVVAVDRLTG
ncbi:MAG: hypothetical protein OEV40_26815 [Acidimicrobiia bacterium]|nr:hypothetical protein [Acidimicrobiia bacterium]